MAETEGPQMTSQHGAHSLQAGQARLHASTRVHTPSIRVPAQTHARTDQ
jgi:hypothetical protein